MGLYLVVLTSWLIVAASQKCQHKSIGMLQLDYPVKNEFLAGTDVRIPCRLANTTFVTSSGSTREVDHTNLRFKRLQFEEILGEESELVVREGNDQIVFVMKNASESQFSLMCLGTMTAADGTTLKLPGCIASVSIGHVPTKVENMSCQATEFKNLTCTWSNPPNKVKTNYSIEVMRSLAEHYLPCPANMSTPTSCLWTQHSNPQYDNKMAKVKVRITGQNSLGTDSWEYEFDHSSIVKLSPVTKLQYAMASPRNATITWTPPGEVQHGGWKKNLAVTYVIQIQCRGCAEPSIFESSEPSHVIPINPNTVYNVTVQCKPSTTTRLDLLSDASSIVIKSAKERPDGPPIFLESAFQYKLFKDSRTITLLFEEIPRAHWNDDKFFYVIQLCTRNEPECKNSTVYNSNVDIEGLSQLKRYDIDIWSGNSLGYSQQSSRITVGTQEELLTSPTDITALLNPDSVKLTWKDARSSTSTEDLDNSVFWCASFNQQTCNGTVFSRRVGNVSDAVISVDSARDYIFGVAISEANGRTSGVAWSTCVIQQGSQMGQIRRLEALPESDTSLNLRWSVGCGFPKEDVRYQVEFCRIDELADDALRESEVCQHPRHTNASEACQSRNITLKHGESHYSLSGLEIGEVYRIIIRALDGSGRFAPDSKAVCALAQGIGMSVYMIVAIAVGSALALFVVICSFYLITRRIQKEHELAKTVFGGAKLPRQLKSDIQYSDHKQRVVELSVMGSNGFKHDQITEDPTATMLSDLNVKGSTSGLDKLIIETSTTVCDESSDDNLAEDSRRPANLNGELANGQHRAVVNNPPKQNGYHQVGTAMPPYTQLGLSAAHYPSTVEQPGNTGYSQLSVIQSMAVPPQSSTPAEPITRPESRPVRTGGYVSIDRARNTPAGGS